LALGNNVDIYEDWNSEDEEADTVEVAAENDGQDGQGVEPIASNLAADTSHQVDEDGDGIQDCNSDTDEIFDKEVDPEDFAVDASSIAQVFGIGRGSLAVSQSFQTTSGDDEGDMIQDFNPDANEVLDELDDTTPRKDKGDNSNVFIDINNDNIALIESLI
jgi:hypothetical protein